MIEPDQKGAEPDQKPPELSEDELERLRTLEMVEWYHPGKLARTALDVATSALLGDRSDYRLIEALTGEQPVFPYADREELWLDYVADVGDGFNPTFAVASALARETLCVGEHTTRRGEVLVMGGDQVYPSAGRESYEWKLVKPYIAAARPAPETRADLFAMAGNHDWYDGLASFVRLFCQGRRIGSWRTRQVRSYFALRLPHGWWLLGIDIQLHADIDRPQLDYFREVVDGMEDGDRIILCTAEPDWIKGTLYNDALGTCLQHNREFFERELEELAARQGKRVSIAVRLAGDLHHYRRHASADGRQNITAGGGGAFLHPTHPEIPEVVSGSDRAVYTHQTSFPTAAESRKLTLENRDFAARNPGFRWTSAALYALLSLAVVPARFASLIWLALALLGVVLLTDTHVPSYRWRAGTLHGFAHLGVVVAVSLLGGLLAPGPMTQSLLAFAGCLAAGYVVGPQIFATYLVKSLNDHGRHANEAFSALRLEGYKNFLRLHVTRERLEIFPVGLREVPTAGEWRRVPEPNSPAHAPGEPYFSAASWVAGPHLIEGPIVVGRPQASANAPAETEAEREPGLAGAQDPAAGG